MAPHGTETGSGMLKRIMALTAPACTPLAVEFSAAETVSWLIVSGMLFMLSFYTLPVIFDYDTY